MQKNHNIVCNKLSHDNFLPSYFFFLSLSLLVVLRVENVLRAIFSQILSFALLMRNLTAKFKIYGLWWPVSIIFLLLCVCVCVCVSFFFSIWLKFVAFSSGYTNMKERHVLIIIFDTRECKPFIILKQFFSSSVQILRF